MSYTMALVFYARFTWVKVKGYMVQGQTSIQNIGRWDHINTKLIHCMGTKLPIFTQSLSHFSLTLSWTDYIL